MVIIATSAALMVGMVTMVCQPVTRLVPPHRYIDFPALLSGGAARPKIDCDLLKSSVGDPWHFGVDLDPDPGPVPLANGSGSDSFLQ